MNEIFKQLSSHTIHINVDHNYTYTYMHTYAVMRVNVSTRFYVLTYKIYS